MKKIYINSTIIQIDNFKIIEFVEDKNDSDNQKIIYFDGQPFNVSDSVFDEIKQLCLSEVTEVEKQNFIIEFFKRINPFS